MVVKAPPDTSEQPNASASVEMDASARGSMHTSAELTRPDLASRAVTVGAEIPCPESTPECRLVALSATLSLPARTEKH